jgi:hypothetical protein
MATKEGLLTKMLAGKAYQLTETRGAKLVD